MLNANWSIYLELYQKVCNLREAGYLKALISILDLESAWASVQIINAQKPNELMETRKKNPGQNEGTQTLPARFAYILVIGRKGSGKHNHILYLHIGIMTNKQ